MDWLLGYGWYFLILGILGEIIIPFVLAVFYKGYSHKKMVLSSLGNVYSPVRKLYNLWMLIAGILFIIGCPALYSQYKEVSGELTVALVVIIIVFAVGACIFTCFFSVNESKAVVTKVSVIHGFGSVVGFMAFLFVPLILGILTVKVGEEMKGIVYIACFIVSLIAFLLFIISDKEKFKETWIDNEGLWQRLNLLFMYLPLFITAVLSIN